MIDKGEFMRAWEHLSARFGRESNAGQAAAYYGFLNDQMDTPAFLQAARALWATAKWFPRPADFLLLSASGEWGLVLDAVKSCHPPEWRWTEPYGRLSDRARSACDALGGIHAMVPVYNKDVLRLKAAWEAAYEQATAEHVLSLPPAGPARRLAPA